MQCEAPQEWLCDSGLGTKRGVAWQSGSWEFGCPELNNRAQVGIEQRSDLRERGSSHHRSGQPPSHLPVQCSAVQPSAAQCSAHLNPILSNAHFSMNSQSVQNCTMQKCAIFFQKHSALNTSQLYICTARHIRITWAGSSGLMTV